MFCCSSSILFSEKKMDADWTTNETYRAIPQMEVGNPGGNPEEVGILNNSYI